MKVLSLKLKQDIFEEVEKVTKQIHISRNAYINEALAFYNQVNRRRMLKKQLHQEAKLVRVSSLEVLKEFDELGDEGIA